MALEEDLAVAGLVVVQVGSLANWHSIYLGADLDMPDMSSIEEYSYRGGQSENTLAVDTFRENLESTNSCNAQRRRICYSQAGSNWKTNA